MAPQQLPETRKLELPPSTYDGRTTIEALGSVVVVGPNGSGKTRLGSWLDINSPQAAVTHRVAAQKSLNIPASSSTSSLDVAENGLLYGYEGPGASAAHKIGHKWGSKPDTFLQNDYERLLRFLFTDELDKSIRYRHESKESQHRLDPPETHLDIVKRIWELVLPDRELMIGGGKVEVRPQGSLTPVWNAAEMSDGERVIFYLIGQSLAAKHDGILVVDEPELHLHRSLQARLWDAIEAERPDCLFVYLTHDLDFAASRISATKLWMCRYEDKKWDWRLLEHDGQIPERLLLEIVGSRKPVLFVEGDRDSLEYFVYSRLYSGHTVTPCGGASDVIHATLSFSALKHLHALACLGIIDRDRRSNEQVKYLAERGTHCLDYSEIENLLLDEAVLQIVAESLHREHVDDDVSQAKALVLDRMEKERERIASAIAASRIEAQLGEFNATAKGEQALIRALTDVQGAIDVPAVYQEALAQVEGIVTAKDYRGALRVFDNKGLMPQLAGIFGMKPGELQKHVKRLIASKDNGGILGALRAAAPKLPGGS